MKEHAQLCCPPQPASLISILVLQPVEANTLLFVVAGHPSR